MLHFSGRLEDRARVWRSLNLDFCEQVFSIGGHVCRWITIAGRQSIDRIECVAADILTSGVRPTPSPSPYRLAVPEWLMRFRNPSQWRNHSRFSRDSLACDADPNHMRDPDTKTTFFKQAKRHCATHRATCQHGKTLNGSHFMGIRSKTLLVKRLV